jgi:transcriptional regulator with XRE-family HTH domain
MTSKVYTKSSPIRFGELLRSLGVEKDVPLRTLASTANMDQAHLSKIELGRRSPTEGQALNLTSFFAVDETDAQARRLGE